MKNIYITITLLFLALATNAQTGLWRLNLDTDNHKESFTLTKKSGKLSGTLNSGGNINITISGTQISGYFKYNKKLYKLKGQKEQGSYGGREDYYGKYCACSGEPNKVFTLSKLNKTATTNMQGTWSSTFGELRLHQNGDKITGDYRNLGIIKARIKGNLVSGTFTNGKKSGIFNWVLGEKSFTGKWAWKGQTLGGKWNATLKSNKKPILKNSTSKGNNTNVSVNPKNKSTGTWSSVLGELKIKQNGNTIRGEIGNNGHLFGFVNEKGEVGPAYFTKGNKKGLAYWKVNGDKITGTWNWDFDKKQQKMTGKLLNQKAPNFIIKKHKNFNGRFRITVTNIYANTYNLLDQSLDMYGAIGIRLKGKSKSGSVTINNIGNKKPKVWDISESNPLALKIKDEFIVAGDLTGEGIGYGGLLEVDKMREFNVSGELANSNLIVNIQTNLAEDKTLGDDKYGWKQRNLYVKDMALGVEYYLEIKSKLDKNKRIYVGFKLEKI